MADRNLLLSLNAGSSSLKICLYKATRHVELQQQQPHAAREPVELLLTSSISNISAPPATFSFNPTTAIDAPHAKDEPQQSITDHASAFAHFLDHLQSQASIDRASIVYICHRVVHGGDYTEPIEITDESYHHIENLSDLAPLHNGAALSVIKACIEALPDAKSIAYFDTTFHTSLPLHVSNYAINPDIAKKRGLRKYGFHGLSYAFILRAVSEYLQKPPTSLNLILLHLGSGASACAIQNGRSLDTTMGLTPLHGLPGATRSGSIDPSLIFHYTNKAGRITHDPSMAAHVGVTLAEDILNRRSGWKAITGTTDFGVITANAELEDKSPDVAGRNRYRLAFDLVVDRVLHYVGAYHLKLHGEVDALVFSGGIGERGVQLRSIISERVACLGYRAVDEEKNAKLDGEVANDISKEGTGKGPREQRILVVKTDEQIEMARECALDPRFWESN